MSNTTLRTTPSAMAPIMAWARVRSGVGHERGEAVDRVEVLLDQALDHRRRLLHAVELAHHLADRVEHDRTALVGVAVAAGYAGAGHQVLHPPGQRIGGVGRLPGICPLAAETAARLAGAPEN